MTITGTLAPSPTVLGSCGGGTWSYQPPLSSQRTINAVLDHAAEFFTDPTRLSSHSMPFALLPEPGCILATGAGVIQTTEGNALSLANIFWKSAREKSLRFM